MNNGGHYVALCRNEKENDWYKYDDNSVKRLNNDSDIKEKKGIGWEKQ